jgi:hypothetical protein
LRRNAAERKIVGCATPGVIPGMDFLSASAKLPSLPVPKSSTLNNPNSFICVLFAGKYAVPKEKLQGAPPLFLIHSSGKEKTTKEKKKTGYKWYEEVEITDVLGRERKIGSAYLSGLGSDIKEEIQHPKEAYEHNPFGFGVATSPNGSMTRELMLDWAVHFVKNLPDGSDGEPKQGKGGEAVILTLDGHISRWNMHALIYMLDNNVLPFFMPSHTSMWGQVNDNGANLSLEKHIQNAAATERMHRNTAPVSYHNRLIFLGVGTYIECEHRHLLLTGTNIAKHGHYICGICPFNPLCINWTGAISTLGQREKLLNEGREKLKGWEIRVKGQDDIDNFTELTDEQMEVMMEGYEGFYGDERDLHIVAMLRAQTILARWREQEMLRLKRKEMQFERATTTAAATEEQQQQEPATTTAAAATEEQQQQQQDLPALEEQNLPEDDDDDDEEEESDPMMHAEGEAEQWALQLVDFVEARDIVEEMGENGHDIGPALPTVDEVTNTILTTTKQHKPITLTYYSRGIDDEAGYIEGTAVKVDAAEWMTCISGFPRGTIFTSTQLNDATKWMVHRPVEFLTSKENAVQMARIKRLDKCERGRMSEEAKKMCRLDREARKREEFEKMKRKVLTGRYSFYEFNQMWKVAEDPFTKTYDVYNRRTKTTEEVKAVIKGNEESATGVLVLTSLAKVMQSRNNVPSNNSEGGGPKRKKQRLGVVATVLGECPFVALNKLKRDARVLRSNDDEDARKRLTDEYNELEKNCAAFIDYADSKNASGHQDLSIVSAAIDKSKGLDHYLRLFYPKSGMLSKKMSDKEDFILNGDQDGRHEFKLTKNSINYKLEQIAHHLKKLEADIARGQPAVEAEPNENEERVEEHAHVEGDDDSILSMDLDLGEDDDDDSILGDAQGLSF